ncbi:MAG: CocE/NonD family hydrolase [Actinomycetota bacterium]|nr:CocE/NonD family hydrolase [Actinomycetota bacterium]
MLPGSGDADRLNGGYLEPIRAHLVRRGIAVISYDKRGVGGSNGDWREATLRELADDNDA